MQGCGGGRCLVIAGDSVNNENEKLKKKQQKQKTLLIVFFTLICFIHLFIKQIKKSRKHNYYTKACNHVTFLPTVT